MKPMIVLLVSLLAAGTIPYLGRPIDTPESLRQKYGPPVAENFLVNPGVVASVRYGASGEVCEMVVSPEKLGLWKTENIKFKPGQLKEALEKLLPPVERGEALGGEFDDGSCGMIPDCSGVTANYKDVVVFRAGSTDAEFYAAVLFKRDECRPKVSDRDGTK